MSKRAKIDTFTKCPVCRCDVKEKKLDGHIYKVHNNQINNTDERYVRTHEDLMAILRSHIKFIKTSARLYDEGDIDEVLRMAGSIRTICKDKGDTESLLTQLGKKDMLFYDTFQNVDRRRYYYDGKNVHLNPSQIGSHYFNMGTGELSAPLDNVPPDCENKKVNFRDWWDKLIFIDMINLVILICLY